ncbi:MAG: hypothetical protein R8G33_02990 [Gammaproteobacteria bacterium]|nr:hypothetical protein [Gammaproteobacteria bacterium]
MEQDHLDSIWNEKPKVIRKFLDLLPLHERLCEEVEFILECLLEKYDIEVSTISSRAKSLNSFCEKMYRKSYDDPFSQMGDLSGARIVFLYMDDLKRIENLIEEEFEIIEKENKYNEEEVEKFGYGALHYIVKIKKDQSVAIYDDLKDIVCEIQVRTILQDAWAIVAHHLAYKQETDVPVALRRKLNALSGLFETADDQIDQLRVARQEYITAVEQDILSEHKLSLNQDINLDNLKAYLHSRFPDREHSESDSVSALFEQLKEINYVKLKELDDKVDKAINAVIAKEKEDPPENQTTKQKTKYTDVGLVRMALTFSEEKYAKLISSGFAALMKEKYKHLL